MDVQVDAYEHILAVDPEHLRAVLVEAGALVDEGVPQ